jgi:hypothetical protein
MSQGHWQMNVLKYPTENNWNPRGPVEFCYLCSDPIVQEIMHIKYSEVKVKKELCALLKYNICR